MRKGVTAMKKQYSRPVVEKISFDYRTQIVTESPSECFGSVMNVKTAIDECGEGQRFYYGWNLKHPGEF